MEVYVLQHIANPKKFIMVTAGLPYFTMSPQWMRMFGTEAQALEFKKYKIPHYYVKPVKLKIEVIDGV